MLCPDDKKGVMSHCNSCFRHTRAPLPCDVSGSRVYLSCDSKPQQGQNKLWGEKQMCWQQSARQLCWAKINGKRSVPLIFIIPITDLLQRGLLLKEMQIIGHRRLSQVRVSVEVVRVVRAREARDLQPLHGAPGDHTKADTIFHREPAGN